MKIYKVLVDELPKTCSGCNYLDNFIFGSNNFCELTGQTIKINVCDKKPEWCPLVVEDVCEWKLIKSDDEDYRWRVFKNCKPDGKMLANGLCDRFCPNCGRRIKHVEENDDN